MHENVHIHARNCWDASKEYFCIAISAIVPSKMGGYKMCIFRGWEDCDESEKPSLEERVNEWLSDWLFILLLFISAVISLVIPVAMFIEAIK
jgi:uncharacterized protein YqhQ